ncbi:hypothetical protein [Gramella sp. AN32]|uniref:Uncharacterized protein n=1 Tax=Christiangramia antarctica TaxID=2058158 RepID=A0ABW5XCY6_9FLAO|nr:hypothetical protein [Gramella sp. AN32]MCM4156550.1 hypothetical protein [Gramella sp. AN32]
MAEIKVEKKKPVWPWILLILIIIIAAALYFVGQAEDDSIDDAMEEMEEVSFNITTNQLTHIA